MAAHLSCEQLRAYVSGEGAAMNKRLTYTVYPQLALDESRPLRDPGCPGCRIGPPKNLRWLRGTVLEVTLGEALEQLREALGTDDFEPVSYTHLWPPWRCGQGWRSPARRRQGR